MTATQDVVSLPRIGDKAPDFQSETTHGVLKFSEWQGNSWVVFFSHPADFTPVCTTELTEFARRSKEFADRNCKLLGVSVDSIHSHLAWVMNMEEKLSVRIPYPMVADISMEVARKFGMIHPNESATATVRALFVIDPERTIRAIIYYPLTNGRNVDEVVRILDALQTSSKHTVATPVDWRPGDKVIVPAPRTLATIDERRTKKDLQFTDFYLAKKDI
jgi:peroxiredoxin (alkyl hydroperoxide reductase subunit C)